MGVCQREGGPVEVIGPGDRVFFEPGENHWHGAAPNRFMAHVAMQQNDESGSPVTWGRHVTDEERRGSSHQRLARDAGSNGRSTDNEEHFMQPRMLGRTGVPVSKLCLGAMTC